MKTKQIYCKQHSQLIKKPETNSENDLTRFALKLCQFNSGVTLLFEHSPNRPSKIEHSEIFCCPLENQLARRFFVKFNLLLLFLIS